jgi:glutamate 5-kinase
MIRADYLFLLTDVDGLYTANPRKDPSARQIHVVHSIPAIRAQVSTKTLGSSLGTGGMETKLIAADIATAAGVRTVITSSKDPGRVLRIIEYDVRMKNTKGKSSALQDRPPHTLFVESPQPIRDLKSWTRHTLNPSGSIVIDEGAYHIISKRESGGRLLAAGVIGVIGAFAAQQAVRIVLRKVTIDQEERQERTHRYRRYLHELEVTQPSSPMVSNDRELPGIPENADAELREEDVFEVGRGLANYNSAQIMAVKGMKRCVYYDLPLASHY